jgi:hypothetical protein
MVDGNETESCPMAGMLLVTLKFRVLATTESVSLLLVCQLLKKYKTFHSECQQMKELEIGQKRFLQNPYLPTEFDAIQPLPLKHHQSLM